MVHKENYLNFIRGVRLELKSSNTSDIINFVKKIKSKDLLKTLFYHYQSIIDNSKITTLNDNVWFFVIKDEIKIKLNKEEYPWNED